MPVQFKAPASRPRSILQVDTFLGVDLTSDPGNVAVTRSPCGTNMIRDVPGKVRKCMGYETIARFQGRVNGYHRRGQDTVGLVHAGTEIYPMDDPDHPLYSQAADHRSKSWQFENKLYILDGKALLVYDGTQIRPASEAAKVPLVTIAKAPGGGGTDYEPLNLLQPKFTEKFAGTVGDTVYCLTFSGLDATPVTARVLNSAGDWVEKAEGTDFTVDRAAGKVTFKTAPGKSPLTGEDNVEITAARTVEGYAARINQCDIGILFGVNGASDRLFIAGNPDYPNYDWYSGQFDPTYWPDTGYSILGTGRSAIIGYSIINNYLAAHKDENEVDRNVIVRQGNLVESTPAFPIINTLQGPGAVAKNSFAYLATEPVFLTRLGVYAVTPSDINGERYSQERSYYVNGQLTRESTLEEAVGIVYKDLYWLCLNGKAYILDGLQSMGTGKGEPYSTRQYACFYRENLPARTLWVEKERLFFGTEDGRICRFFDDPDALASYADDGAPIRAVWETPDLTGNRFYKNKTFRYLAVQLASAVATGIQIHGQKRGIWALLKQDGSRARFFSYRQLCYSKFTYSNDQTNKTLHTKIRLKRLDKVRFRFENDSVNEPFGLMRYALEYVEGGNYKG